MVALASVLTPRREVVILGEDGFAEWTPITIHFDGSMEPRDLRGKEDFKGRLFAVYPGDLVFSKIDARNGAIGLLPAAIPRAVVTAEYPVCNVDETQVVPEYMALFLQTADFKQSVNDLVSGTSGRKRVQPEAFTNLPIPLPPLETQRALVSRWQQAQAEIAAAKERAQQLSDSAAQDIIHAAGIVLKPLVKRPAVFAMAWSKAERWGVEFNRWDWSPETLLSSARHSMRRLAEIAWINPPEPLTLADSDLVSFVPMAAVSDELGEIVAPEIRPYQEVKSGYTRFREQDVIWAKITPCMQNGKCAVAKNLENGVGCGSTEFHVIRTKDAAQVLPEYLWVILRLHHVREAAQRYFIGSAGQQRVPADFLEELHIPLPPLALQREIVAQVAATHAEVVRLRAQVAQRAQESAAEIEAAILPGKKGMSK